MVLGLELELELERERERELVPATGGNGRARGDWVLELTCRRGAVFACGFLLCSVNFVRCSISGTVWIVLLLLFFFILLLLVCGLVYGSFV